MKRILNFFKSKPKLAISLSAVAVLTAVFIVLAAAGLIFNKSDKAAISAESVKILRQLSYDNTNITPVSSDSAGVDLESGFRISSTVDLDGKYLNNILRISPVQEFKIETVSKKEYLVKFDTNLKADSIYKLALGDGSQNKLVWAFQTKKSLRVTGTLPRDKTNYVPLNTGIEITLSYEGVQNFENYFEITPNVKGRFEYHKKTVVFAPENLAENTVYTVTLKKGLQLKDSNEKLDSDYTFSFQTQSGNNSDQAVSYFTDDLYNFTPQDTPAMEVYADDKAKNSEATVDVYKYSDEKRFLDNIKATDKYPSWAYIDRSKLSYDSTGLAKQLSFKAKLSPTGEDWWKRYYVVLPSSLPEGQYLVKTSINGKSFATNLQISDASVYIAVAKNQTLVWVNNTVNGGPEAATIEADGIKAVKTDKDGTALIKEAIPKPVNGSNYYFKISRQGKAPFIAQVQSETLYNEKGQYSYSNYNNNDVNNEYWTYMFLDRGLYLPSDSVNIWGSVKPRDGSKLKGKAVIQITSNNYTLDSSSGNALQEKEIQLDSSGSYMGKFDYFNYSPGYYNINLVIDGRTIVQKSFEVKQYQKPAYTLNIIPSRNFMFGWENLNYNVGASFFEGTPVSGLKLNYYLNSNGKSQEGKLTCNSSGNTNLSITPDKNTLSWRPLQITLNLYNAQAEEQEVSANNTVLMFPKDTMIEAKGKRSGNNETVEVSTNLIDISKLKTENLYPDSSDYKGAPRDMKIKARIYEEHWEKSEIGEYYDFINKTTVKKYEYDKVSNLAKELEFSTVNGKYNFDLPITKDSSYRLVLDGTDTRNNAVEEETYVYPFDYSYNNSAENSYTLGSGSETQKYKVNDRVDINLLSNNSDFSAPAGSKTLFMTLKNGIADYKIQSENKYSFSFSNDDIPNIYVMAVYFDGKRIYGAGIKPIIYDYSEKNLQIEVKADKQEYKPGDTANLNVTVKDSKGNPCKADVNLSIVDEAFFAVRDQYVDTLNSIYSYMVASGIITDYLSYTPIDLNSNPKAEQGGEGGDTYIRSNFKDTAFFNTLHTDNSGKAKASFKLPDNLTTWRVTYQGITSDIKAGSGKTSIKVTQPYFVNAIFNDIFMNGDSPAVTTRVFGSNAAAGGKVDYSIILEGPDGRKSTLTNTGTVGLCTVTPIGKLTTGDYSMTVTARSGSLSDSMKKDFKVVDNLLEAGRSKSYKLEQNTKPQGGKTITKLVFYNNDSSAVYDTLDSLRYSWGERIDQKLSRKIAADLLKQYYNEDVFNQEDTDFQMYQQNDGGIALMKYGSSDPELSARVCTVAKGLFDETALKSYFYNTITNKDSTPEAVAASYWGLAALNEPVLIDIKNLINNPSIGVKEKLYLAAALADIGDISSAKDIYSKLLSSYGKRETPYTYIDAASRDDIVELTALCSVTALKINAPEKLEMISYVNKNSTKDILANLEQLYFVANTIPNCSQAGKFNYTLNGSTKTVILDKNEKYELDLTSDMLNNIKFESIQGDIRVVSSFEGPVNDLMSSSGGLATIKRSYSVDGITKNSFKQSDLIKVTLQFDFKEAAPDGYYEVTDVLPAGLDYVSSGPMQYEPNTWYPVEQDGQKLVFGSYYDKNNIKDMKKTITYYVRATSPGTFTADNAMIKHYGSDIAGFTGKQQIQIGK